jgi:alpha-ketoglutarate-dependent 2,4-dichlorophenoxyacetate dioxygenase
MAVTVRQLHHNFVGEIDGVDLRRVDAATFAKIEAAFERLGVLVFHDQELDEDEQIEFSRLFGPLETNIGALMRKDKRRLRPEFADISNVDEQHEILSPDDRRRNFSKADRLWHTDSSFRHIPAKCSLLYAVCIPPAGGETEFVDLRAVYEALPASRRDLFDGLIAEHSIFHSRAQVGFSDFSAVECDAFPPVQQLLIRFHRGSQRKTIYLASHASHIVGWPLDQGQALLRELMAFATQPQFVYQHRWQAGDLVIWDNRCTRHRGRPYDDQKYKRELRRTTVEDEGNTVALAGRA